MNSRALAHLEQAIMLQAHAESHEMSASNKSDSRRKFVRQKFGVVGGTKEHAITLSDGSGFHNTPEDPITFSSSDEDDEEPQKMPQGMHNMYVNCLVCQQSRMEGAGKGVFATCEIKADTLIGRYRGRLIYSRINPGKIMNFDEHRRAQFNQPEDHSDDPHRREYTMCDWTNTPEGEMIDGWPGHAESNWIPLINGAMTSNQKANVEVLNHEEATALNNETKQIRSMVGKQLKGVWYKALVDIKASPRRKVELVTDYGPNFFNEQRTLRENPQKRKQFDPTLYDKNDRKRKRKSS